VPYLIGFMASIIVAGTVWEDGNKQLGARIGLLTPVWPVTLVYGVYLLIGFLWKHAELELRKDRP
jgi:hypothetical protein